MNELNFGEGLIVSVISVVITAVLLFKYYTHSISIIECMVYGFATQAFSVSFLGPTITTLYLVVLWLAFDELLFIIKNKLSVRFQKTFLILLLFPLVCYCFTAIDYFIIGPLHFYIIGSHAILLFQPFFFYFKAYLPVFLVGSKLFRNVHKESIGEFYDVIVKVALWSCYIACFQFVLDKVTSNEMIRICFGMKPGFEGGAINLVRLSAFFNEPKHLSAFLALAIPLFLSRRKFVQVFLLFIIGVLTISQTFYICLFSAFFCFIIYKRIISLRKIVLFSLATLLIISTFFSLIADYAIQNTNPDSFLYKVALGRAVARYELNGETDGDGITTFAGLPLQPDLELPVVKFLNKYPYLLLFGYGPGNGKFIPPAFFENSKMSYRYDAQLKSNSGVHLNMRWIYVAAEFGVIYFILFFIIFTGVKCTNSFTIHYYGYFFLVFFFNEIDYLLLIFFLCLFFLKKKEIYV